MFWKVYRIPCTISNQISCSLTLSCMFQSWWPATIAQWSSQKVLYHKHLHVTGHATSTNHCSMHPSPMLPNPSTNTFICHSVTGCQSWLFRWITLWKRNVLVTGIIAVLFLYFQVHRNHIGSIQFEVNGINVLLGYMYYKKIHFVFSCISICKMH